MVNTPEENQENVNDENQGSEPVVFDDVSTYTNPGNIVRVRARNGGRASVYEANGWCQSFSMGVLEGNGVTQNTSADMNVLVGGSPSKPDVVIAQNPSGYKVALDLVGQQAVAITAPASGSRHTVIVAYTDDLALSTTETNVTGSPSSCGLIVVNGSNVASPSDAQIRSAITADGATGSQASYAILADINVSSNTTMITNSLITRVGAKTKTSLIDFSTMTRGEARNITSDFSPTEPGILFVKALINTNTYGSRAIVYVNGIEAWSFSQFSTSGGYNYQTAGCIPLLKDDVVTFTIANDAEWSIRKFQPFH